MSYSVSAKNSERIRIYGVNLDFTVIIERVALF